MATNSKRYEYWRNGKLVTTGTIDEIAAVAHIDAKSVKFYLSQAHIRRTNASKERGSYVVEAGR